LPGVVHLNEGETLLGDTCARVSRSIYTMSRTTQRTTRKSTRSRRQRPRSRRAGMPTIPHPPRFKANFEVSKTFRFAASSGTTVNITPDDLLDLWCMATTANSAYRILTAVRLNSISIWGPMAATLDPVTVAIEFQSLSSGAPFGAPTRSVSDTSMGSTECAFVKTSPPPKSLAAQWWNSGLTTGVDNVMSLTFPLNAIVDVQLTGICGPGSGLSSQVGAAVAAATVGEIYVRALDSNGGVVLVPVGFQTV
jgi:hypothetical protein